MSKSLALNDCVLLTFSQVLDGYGNIPHLQEPYGNVYQQDSYVVFRSQFFDKGTVVSTASCNTIMYHHISYTITSIISLYQTHVTSFICLVFYRVTILNFISTIPMLAPMISTNTSGMPLCCHSTWETRLG